MNTCLKLIALCALGGVAQSAAAADAHFKGQGPDKTPVLEDRGLYLVATGQLSGLSNTDIEVDIVATGNAITLCTNQGGNMAPGQNPASLTLSGSLLIDAEDLAKNGTVGFTLATQGPYPVVPDAPDCPNPNWTETVVDVSFTGLVVSVQQPVGYTVLEAVCTFDPPTTDGVIPRDTISCSVTQY